MFIGLLVGGFSMGYLMDFYGRKATGVYIRFVTSDFHIMQFFNIQSKVSFSGSLNLI